MEATEQTNRELSVERERIKYRKGITRRLIFYIVLFSSFITLLITAFQLYGEYQDGVHDVEGQIAQLETLSLPGLTENLWNLYEKQIQIQLDDLIQQPDLRYLEIRSGGETLASAGTPTFKNTISQTLPIIYQRDGESIPIGEIFVVATLEGVYEDLKDRIVIILISNGFKTALVTIFIFFIFQFLVTRHLVSICEHLQRLSPDRLDRKLSLYRPRVEDELQLVVTTINQMGRNLDQSIKERKRAEEELRRRERLATIGQMTATVSHELRNPLGSLRNSIATIKKVGRDLPPLMSSSIEIAERSVKRCDNIIGELLSYSRQSPLELEAAAFDEWLGEVLDEYALPPGIELGRALESGARFAFDPERMRRVVLNLLDNACQAMAEQEMAAPGSELRLTVATRSIGDRLELAISDTGPGLPPEDMDKVFEPLHSTKSHGVGLGLPIVRQIVEQHGGRVELTSEPGHGAEVVVSLPLKVAEVRAVS